MGDLKLSRRIVMAPVTRCHAGTGDVPLNRDDIATFYPGGKKDTPVTRRRDQREKGISNAMMPQNVQRRWTGDQLRERSSPS